MTNTNFTTAFPTLNTTNLAKMFIGFDSMFTDVENRFANQLQTNYPPHNIIKLDENNYCIEISVAGFDKEDVAVEIKENLLTIIGKKAEVVDDTKVDYMHRGLAFRNFERSFTIAEHMVAKNAEIKNGVLRVAFEKIIPEAKKPRLLEIL